MSRIYAQHVMRQVMLLPHVRLGYGQLACLLAAIVTSSAAASTPPIVAVCVSPQKGSVARYALTGSQLGLQLRDLQSLQVIRTVAVTFGTVHDVAFAPSGNQVAIVGGVPGQLGAVQVLRWPQLTVLATNASSDDLVYATAWRPRPESNQLGLACHDASVVLVRLGNLQRKSAAERDVSVQRLTAHSKTVRAISFVNDQIFVTGGADRSLRVWSVGQPQPQRVLNQHTGSVLGLASEPESVTNQRPRVASVANDRTIRIWQPTIGRLVRFVRLDVTPLCVCWGTDGRWVMAGCDDGSVVVVDPQTAKIRLRRKVAAGWLQAIAPVDDRTVIVGSSDGVVRRMSF